MNERQTWPLVDFLSVWRGRTARQRRDHARSLNGVRGLQRSQRAMTPPAHWGLGCSLPSPSSSLFSLPLPGEKRFLFFATKRHVEDKGLIKKPWPCHLSPGAVSLATRGRPSGGHLLACAALRSSGWSDPGHVGSVGDVQGSENCENLGVAAGNGQKEEPKH